MLTVCALALEVSEDRRHRAAWQRRGLPVDVSPLSAATLALWAWQATGDYDALDSVW